MSRVWYCVVMSDMHVMLCVIVYISHVLSVTVMYLYYACDTVSICDVLCIWAVIDCAAVFLDEWWSISCLRVCIDRSTGARFQPLQDWSEQDIFPSWCSRSSGRRERFEVDGHYYPVPSLCSWEVCTQVISKPTYCVFFCAFMVFRKFAVCNFYKISTYAVCL